jgi:hypothetical protein
MELEVKIVKSFCATKIYYLIKELIIYKWGDLAPEKEAMR